MNRNERMLVRNDQIRHFFNSYYSGWRLSKILSNEKLLTQKYDFFKDIISNSKQYDDPDGEATIAQEITNGLFFDCIANSVQYIEDLFALLKAGSNPDFFIREISNYGAGKVENMIKANYSIEQLCKLFYFPFFSELDPSDKQDFSVLECYNRIKAYIKKLQDYYEGHRFFYIQYKHGLSIALRAFNKFDGEQIEKDKETPRKPYIAAFDAASPSKVKREGTRFGGMLFMPGFTEPVRRNLDELMKEDNLTRWVFLPPSTDMALIKDMALISKICIDTFIGNLVAYLDPANNEYQLPAETQGKALKFSFQEDPFAKL